MDRQRFFAAAWLVLILAVTTVGPSPANAGVILITPDEARLPAARDVASSRAITRGPRIEVSGLEDGKLHSPLHFKLKFRAFGGSTTDLDTLAVTYLRGSYVDLTPRIRPFVQPTGIDIPDAEVPPGEHAIRIELKDSEGRTATTSFLLAVTPN
jgi:hypothetical protein